MTVFRSAVLAMLLTALLLSPALINRGPILYPDSAGYFHAGQSAVSQIAARVWPGPRDVRQPGHGLERQERDGISTARSVYYGAPFALTGRWVPIIGQALLTALCLLLAARRVMPGGRLAAVAAIACVSGISVFASAAMPDIFAGLSILVGAMVLAYGRALPRWEYGFWLAVALAAALTHKATLAILVLVLLLSAAALWRRSGRDLAALTAVAVIGVLGHFAVELSVKAITGKPPVAPPFLLARMIADGPAEQYLRDVCPTRRFVTCNYLSKFSLTENQFLWSPDPKKSVMGTADGATRAAITAESGEIILGTLAAYPLAQVMASASNVARQFWTVGVEEYGFIPNALSLRVVSHLMLMTYFLALAATGWLLIINGVNRFAAILLLGVFANAAICGAISGVFDRYQGRVAWLALLAFAALYARWQKSDANEQSLAQWHDFTPLPWQNFNTIDGQPMDILVQRRKVKGAWQYRNCSQQEIDDFRDRSAR